MTTMKKTFGLLAIALMLASCGGIESDAKRVAELSCESQKLSQKMSEGDISVMTEGAKIMVELKELKEKVDSKYTSDEDKQKFEEAVEKAMLECQN